MTIFFITLGETRDFCIRLRMRQKTEFELNAIGIREVDHIVSREVWIFRRRVEDLCSDLS